MGGGEEEEHGPMLWNHAEHLRCGGRGGLKELVDLRLDITVVHLPHPLLEPLWVFHSGAGVRDLWIQAATHCVLAWLK